MAAPWRAEYALTVAGVTVMEAQVVFDIDGAGYRVETRTRSRGLATLVARGHSRALAEGAWRNGAAQPRRYETEGQWRGAARNVTLDYPGGSPRIRRLEPPEDMPRTPVPEEALPGTLAAPRRTLLHACARVWRLRVAKRRVRRAGSRRLREALQKRGVARDVL